MRQLRETLVDAGYALYCRLVTGGVILSDLESGQLELFHPNDGYAGWVVVIDGIGHEFVRGATPADHFEMELSTE